MVRKAPPQSKVTADAPALEETPAKSTPNVPPAATSRSSPPAVAAPPTTGFDLGAFMESFQPGLTSTNQTGVPEPSVHKPSDQALTVGPPTELLQELRFLPLVNAISQQEYRGPEIETVANV
ncbi:hypothetical protein PHYPSEUDO_002158 [Phytophthora pseudosyringae]|uniref:Uncharacterized protein n=1 Tax=Phytophthora pseudosyringae TaxID=221518 RepID=A0A8T1VY39_9STRA|nr:hypothetical protein PHYPSEUDO_002158 [Phytophthora pseudosyringae]